MYSPLTFGASPSCSEQATVVKCDDEMAHRGNVGYQIAAKAREQGGLANSGDSGESDIQCNRNFFVLLKSGQVNGTKSISSHLHVL